MGKIKVRKYLRDELRKKYEKGKGHPKSKGIHNETPYIHSLSTYKTYLAQCNHFSDWLSQQGIKDKDEAYNKVNDYLQHLEAKGKSAFTIYTALCAISKAYGVATDKFKYKPPKRERNSIKRSRYTTQRDKHFSAINNQDLITFCVCTGLRRRELEALHGNDLIYKNDIPYIYVKNGKGGKKRYVEIIGSKKEQRQVIDMMIKASDGKVFNHVHSNADIHSYRAVYACRAYKKYERNLEEIDKKDIYICRKDKAGIRYDKYAMKRTSELLGHNRIDVIALNYLYNL